MRAGDLNNPEVDFQQRLGREPPTSTLPAEPLGPRGSRFLSAQMTRSVPSCSPPSPARGQIIHTQSGSASGSSPTFFLYSRPRPPPHPGPPAATTVAYGSTMRSQLSRHRSGSSSTQHQLLTLQFKPQLLLTPARIPPPTSSQHSPPSSAANDTALF